MDAHDNLSSSSASSNSRSGETDLDQLREEIALIQLLDLQEHSEAYEQIHAKLEAALRSIDGK